VPHENDVPKVVGNDQVGDVGDVRVEPDIGACQVDLVSVAGERRGEHPVPGFDEQRCHPLPALAAVPRAVHE
jgi:hypothetical protein